MAIKNPAWRQGEYVPPGAEPGLTKPFVWRDVEQDRAAHDIARTRFDFPDMQHPDLKTFANRPARQVGVRKDTEDKELVFPDIVVMTDPGNEVRMIGEVETHRSLRETSEADLVEKWNTFTGLGAVYLFVPLMRVEQVKGILKRNKVQAEIRSWRYVAGQDMLVVGEV